MAMNPKLKKALVIGIPALGGLILIMVIARRGSSSSANTGVVTPAGTASTSGTASQLAAFENSVGTALSGLSSTITTSNDQVISAISSLGAAGGTTTTTPTATTTTGTPPTSGGSGGGTNPGSSGGGGTSTGKAKTSFASLGYAWVHNFAVAQADMHAGEQLYFNATGPGGVPTPTPYKKGTKLPKGTTLYVKAG